MFIDFERTTPSGPMEVDLSKLPLGRHARRLWVMCAHHTGGLMLHLRIVGCFPCKALAKRLDEVMQAYNEAIRPAHVDREGVVLTICMEASWKIVRCGSEFYSPERKKSEPELRGQVTACSWMLWHFADECMQLIGSLLAEGKVPSALP